MRHGSHPFAERTSETNGLDELLPVMESLDHFLDLAVTAARNVFAQEATTHPKFRGLYVTEAEVQRHLHSSPTLAEREFPDWFPEVPEGSHVAWIQQAFELSRFDLAALVIALAPDFDLRYERVYAYLQDDVTRKRPTVDLVLGMLCRSFKERLQQRSRFSRNAPLMRHALLRLVPDPPFAQPPLLAHSLRVDDQVIRLLLGQDGLDPRLASFCRSIEPPPAGDDPPIGVEAASALLSLTARAQREREPLRLYFRGVEGSGKRSTAAGLAARCGLALLKADLARGLGVETSFDELLRVLFREAWLSNAVLYLDGVDTLRMPEHILAWRTLMEALAADQGVTVLAGARAWIRAAHEPPGVIEVCFDVPNVAGRRAAWRAALAEATSAPNGPRINGLTIQDIDDLAARYRLVPAQITDAVAVARNYALLRAVARQSAPQRPSDIHLNAGDLFAAARGCSGHELATLARRVTPCHTWQNIVLPAKTTAQLREVCDQARFGHIVYDCWGFGRRLSLGKGLNVLFCGAPGTGKTMAADVIAGELGLDLYKIDLSRVVSKYIGDTEKNLDRIFDAAATSNTILLFDEADTICGKRSQVKDAHDRYANIEVGYLLQKMEEYEGIAILCTNLRANMDQAFTRRLRFIVEFPFPEETDRLRIWNAHFPSEAPQGQDIDLEFVARQFRIAGGNIRNIVLNASFLAASEGVAIGMAHLLCATRRELAKMGRDCMPAEFGPYLDLVNSIEHSSNTARQQAN
jgi:hypothetical protein